MKDSTAELTWEVFTSDPLQTFGDDPPPGQQHRIWPPISSTLIAGRNSAVLVDAPITTAQAAGLADRVAATGKSLTDIYITHGHPDHWFGASVLLDRFPGARIVALPGGVYQAMISRYPDRLFPGALWASACELKPEYPGGL
jgi:glyoxylase-like metal-dependent hydrolase (beta-lactamase superfamily II)